ncbi:hypothetical protein K440DRAFT_631845 [Wilcoxina mikolae CBS 423.85]|nr:hypothetical protein K440DRAFT_631845 [Wilcoxina mikolae CBS 423.85]
MLQLKPSILFSYRPATGKPIHYELELPVPTVVDKYHRYTGGIDIANQYRESYTTPRPTRRNWMSIFYYIFVTAVNL